MNICRFVTRDIAVCLKGHRPLTGWEMLALVYHSRRPLSEKKAAYLEMVAEFSGDHDLVKHLKRIIMKIEDALEITRQRIVREPIFVACSAVRLIVDCELEEDQYPDEKGFFSSYRKAKAFLDAERAYVRELIAPDPLKHCAQSITEYELDSQRAVATWWLNDRGRVFAYEDADSRCPLREPLPEFRYLHLPAVFKAGELLMVREYNSQRSYFGIAVAPYDSDALFQALGSVKPRLDMSVVVLCFDPLSLTVKKRNCSLWDLERYTGALPESQETLLKIARHFSRKELLSAKAIQSLDPLGYFCWSGLSPSRWTGFMASRYT